MSMILSKKHKNKKKLANVIDKNTNVDSYDLAVHCYYYELLLRAKAYLLKNNIGCDKKTIKDYNRDNKKNYSSHDYIINHINKANNKENPNGILTCYEIGVLFKLRNARVKADYDESESFINGVSLNITKNETEWYTFKKFMDDYKKVDLAFSSKGI